MNYQTDAGLEIRVGYGEGLLRSQFARDIGRRRQWLPKEGLSLQKGFQEIN